MDYIRADQSVCPRCGLRCRPHKSVSECIAALGEIIAWFEFRADGRRKRRGKGGTGRS